MSDREYFARSRADGRTHTESDQQIYSLERSVVMRERRKLREALKSCPRNDLRPRRRVASHLPNRIVRPSDVAPEPRQIHPQMGRAMTKKKVDDHDDIEENGLTEENLENVAGGQAGLVGPIIRPLPFPWPPKDPGPYNPLPPIENL